MAVPFRRTSKTKKRMRRTHLKKEVGTLTTCPKCGATLRPHRACAKCGFYKGQDALKLTKEEDTKVEKVQEKAPKKASKKVKEAKTAE